MATPSKKTSTSSALQRRAPASGSSGPALPAGTAADIVEAAQPPQVELPGKADKEQAANMVTVIVPKPFTLTHDNGTHTSFEAGVQEMDEGHATHWFSKAQGVTVYKPNK